MPISLIAAIDKKQGFAKDGKIPWHIPQDLKYFQNTTITTLNYNKQNAIIMGRITWESLPKKYRPLKNRLNIVISSQKIDHDLIFPTLQESLDYLETREDVESIFVVGGQKMYEEAINS